MLVNDLNSSRYRRRSAFMAGASVLAFAIAGSPGAQARPIGSNQASSATSSAANAALLSAQQAAAIANNAQNSLARATKALQALQALQNAARNLAVSGPNNLGLDPNHSGLQLPDVADGLNTGGLVPSSGLAG